MVAGERLRLQEDEVTQPTERGRTMAACDYRLCDVCEGKALYDAELHYHDAKEGEGVLMAGKDPMFHKLGNVGDWAVLCVECAKTHRTAIVPKDSS